MAMRLSIRHVVWLGFALLIAGFSAATLSTGLGLFEVNRQAGRMVHEIEPTIVDSLGLSGELQRAAGALGFFLLSKEEGHLEGYRQALQRAETLLAALEQRVAGRDDPRATELVRAVAADVERFKGYQEVLLQVAHQELENLPALRFSMQEVNPLNQQMLQKVGEMIFAEQEESPSEERAPLAEALHRLRYDWANMVNVVRAYLAFRNQASLGELADYRTKLAELLDRIAAHGELLTLDQEDSLARARELYHAYFRQIDQMIAIHSSERWRTDAFLVRTELGPLLEAIDGRVRELVAGEQERAEGIGGELIASAERMLAVVVATLIGGIVVGIGIMFATGRRIGMLMDGLRGAFLTLAEGDLTKRMAAAGRTEIAEIGRHFNAFVEALDRSMRHITQTNERVSSSAAEIYMAADETSRDIATQSARIGEMAAAMGQMRAAALDMAGNAGEVSNAARHALTLASGGEAVVTRAVGGMEAIRRNTASSADTVRRLGEQSREIGAVAEVITEIAEQTNLLALNAAIEAARAGEQGRGFAVVADEVRTLAQKTASATEQITRTINSIQRDTESSVAAIGEMAEGVEAGVRLIGEAGTALAELVAGSEAVAARMESIAGAIEEQSATTEQVAANIEELVAVSRHLAGNGERNAGIAQQLAHGIAREQEGIVKRFRLARDDGAGVDEAQMAERLRQVPPLVPWDASFSVGVAAIDGQHRELVGLVNHLNAAMRSEGGERVIGQVLDRLIHYTRTHFRDEEALMRQHGYADPAHLAAHAEFTRQAEEVQRRFHEGQAGVSTNVLNFLSDWLVNHIKGVDRRYQPHLNARGVR